MDRRRLGPEADEELAGPQLRRQSHLRRRWKGKSFALQGRRAASDIAAAQQVHAGLSDEGRNEGVRRVLVEVFRIAQLLHCAGAQHGDPVGDRERVELIVGHHDHGGAEFSLEPPNLASHRLSQTGVEVADRLVEQVQVRLLHDRAADRHPLLFPSGNRLDSPIEERFDAEQTRDAFDALGDLAARGPPYAQRIGKIFAHGHVRIERIALEHHADAAVAGLNSRNFAISQEDVPFVDLLQPSNNPQ